MQQFIESSAFESTAISHPEQQLSAAQHGKETTEAKQWVQFL
jgi:hypothetical protein